MLHAVLPEWHANQWSSQILSWESEWDYKLVDNFDAAHPLIIPFQLSRVESYFDMYYLSNAEYKNGDILKIHLTLEEPP